MFRGDVLSVAVMQNLLPHLSLPPAHTRTAAAARVLPPALLVHEELRILPANSLFA